MPDTFIIENDWPNTRHKGSFIQSHFSFSNNKAPDYVRLWATAAGEPCRTQNGHFYSEDAESPQRGFSKPVELGLVCMVLDPRKVSIDGTAYWISGYIPIWEEYLSIVQSCTDLAGSNLNSYYHSKIVRSMPTIVTRRIDEALGRVFMMANTIKSHTVESARRALAKGLIEDAIFREKENLEKAIELSAQEVGETLCKAAGYQPEGV